MTRSYGARRCFQTKSWARRSSKRSIEKSESRSSSSSALSDAIPERTGGSGENHARRGKCEGQSEVIVPARPNLSRCGHMALYGLIAGRRVKRDETRINLQ